jgi:ATP-dependent Clp protease ATP-binding subunit ClpA
MWCGCAAAAVPDKAIDLVDEACANVRVQLDSVPEDIDALQRQRYRLQVEEKALSKEKDKARQKHPLLPSLCTANTSRNASCRAVVNELHSSGPKQREHPGKTCAAWNARAALHGQFPCAVPAACPLLRKQRQVLLASVQ